MRFPATVLLGVTLAVSVLGALTIGPFVLPLVGVLAWALLREPRRRIDVAALLLGLAIPLLWVAWSNRHGPGAYCTGDATSTICEEQWSPWPWVAAAMLLIAGAVSKVAAPGRGQSRR